MERRSIQKRKAVGIAITRSIGNRGKEKAPIAGTLDRSVTVQPLCPSAYRSQRRPSMSTEPSSTTMRGECETPQAIRTRKQRTEPAHFAARHRRHRLAMRTLCPAGGRSTRQRESGEAAPAARSDGWRRGSWVFNLRKPCQSATRSSGLVRAVRPSALIRAIRGSTFAPTG